VKLDWKRQAVEVPGSEREMPADLVLLAMGSFLRFQSVLEALGVEKDARGNAKATTDGGAATPLRPESICRWRHAPGPVARRVGDPRRTPMRRAVDEFLMGSSELPR